MSWVRSVKMALSSSGDGARRSDRKRTQVYNISQVMELLADSSDDSRSDLNLADLDIGGNSTASDGEGGDIPAPAESEPSLPSTSAGLSLGHGGCRRMGVTASTRKRNI